MAEPMAVTGKEPDAAPEAQLTGRGPFQRALMYTFVVGPLLALVAVAPLAARYGWFNWHDFVIGFFFYCVTTAGVGMGLHRHFTHRSFKAHPALRLLLAIAGSLAIEGPVLTWVADHRKHHQFSDREGDPHSPWRFGDSGWALIKGLLFAHMGWFLGDSDRADPRKFALDLVGDGTEAHPGDRMVLAVSRLFPLFVVISLGAPALIGGLWGGSWQAAATAFLWGTLVRMSLMHHVTWSINSVCHTFGDREFESRDKSRNVLWLAIPSFGESWHNIHHADPALARHGVGKWRLDVNARLIWLCERLKLAWDVNWPEGARLEKLERKRIPATT